MSSQSGHRLSPKHFLDEDLLISLRSMRAKLLSCGHSISEVGAEEPPSSHDCPQGYRKAFELAPRSFATNLLGYDKGNLSAESNNDRWVRRLVKRSRLCIEIRGLQVLSVTNPLRGTECTHNCAAEVFGKIS